MIVSRCAAAAVVAVSVFAAAPVARPASSPPNPPSAPSEYIEVVPTAGGGAVAGSGSRSPSREEGSSSAVGAAADAIGSGDEWLLGVGAVLLATTLSLVAARALRRRRPHEPKGW